MEDDDDFFLAPPEEAEVEFHQISEQAMYSDRERVGRAGEKDLQTYITDSKGNLSSLIRRFHHMGEKDTEIFTALLGTFYNMLGGDRKFGKDLAFFLAKATICKWVHMKSAIAFLLGYLAIRTTTAPGLFGRPGKETHQITPESLERAYVELGTFKRFEPAIEKIDILRYARIWTTQLLGVKVEPLPTISQPKPAGRSDQKGNDQKGNDQKGNDRKEDSQKGDDHQSDIGLDDRSASEAEEYLVDEPEEVFETDYL